MKYAGIVYEFEGKDIAWEPLPLGSKVMHIPSMVIIDNRVYSNKGVNSLEGDDKLHVELHFCGPWDAKG